MKSERRHELQTNTLAIWLSEKGKSIGQNSTWYIAGGIAIVLILIFAKVSRDRSAEAQQEGWATLRTVESAGYQAIGGFQPNEQQFNDSTTTLEKLAGDNSGSSLGTMAAMSLADLQMFHGNLYLRRSRQASNEAFQKAANAYTMVIEDKSADSMLVNLARFRRGRSYEWRNMLSDAIADYEATEGPYATKAATQVAFLKSNGATAWYDEFDQLDLTQRPVTPLQDFSEQPFSEDADALEKTLRDALGDAGVGTDDATSEEDSATQDAEGSDAAGEDSTPASEDKSANDSTDADAATDDAAKAPAE